MMVDQWIAGGSDDQFKISNIGAVALYRIVTVNFHGVQYLRFSITRIIMRKYWDFLSLRENLSIWCLTVYQLTRFYPNLLKLEDSSQPMYFLEGKKNS
jgi:hypothetical protein